MTQPGREAVPKAEQQLEEWQTAVENLINPAEVGDGWLMLARNGVMRALNRHVERVFNPDRKDHHWGAASWRGIGDGSRAASRDPFSFFDKVSPLLTCGRAWQASRSTQTVAPSNRAGNP
jgi:hypothetical protein